MREGVMGTPDADMFCAELWYGSQEDTMGDQASW